MHCFFVTDESTQHSWADLAVTLAKLAGAREDGVLTDVLVAFETRTHVNQASFFNLAEREGFEAEEVLLPAFLFSQVVENGHEGELGHGTATRVRAYLLRLLPRRTPHSQARTSGGML